MSIDAYSPCPGGTGKKIKFCCSDFLAELEKIDGMLEGEQYAACLQHIEMLRRQPANADRRCLLAHQVMLLRFTGRLDEAEKIADEFLQKYPTNQIALSESAMLAVMNDDFKPAMNFLQRSFAEAKGAWVWQTRQAAEELVESFLDHGRWVPARALLQLLNIALKNDQGVARLLTNVLRASDVPLLLKEDHVFPAVPKGVPWAEDYTQALKFMMYGDWTSAEEKLSALAGKTDDHPALWREAAVLRSWLYDYPGAVQALRKYATTDIPLEDAIEAEATAMLLSDDPLGDAVPVMNAVWTVNDAERLQEALSSDSRVAMLPPDQLAFQGEDSPPPKAIYMVFNRPAPESIEEIPARSLPVYLGKLFVFGRQTDRAARIQLVGATESEMSQIEAILRELAGQYLDGETITEQVTTVSATETMLQPKLRPPAQYNPQQLRAILIEHRRDVVLNRWPDLNLGSLDGLSPRSAAQDAKYRIKLPASIMVLQYYADKINWLFDFNELRGQLGLPSPEPIDLEPGKINQLPLTRLNRLNVEKLSDEDLVRAFNRGVGYRHRAAAIKFGDEIINRPSFADRKERMFALMTLARMADDADRALAYIEAGRKADDGAGKSNAVWDLEELSLRFARSDIAEALELVRHIEHAHIEEPNVSMALSQILVDVGLLRPDGTPAMPPNFQETEMAPAGASDAEPAKLWTPGGESSGGSGKLWVPE